MKTFGLLYSSNVSKDPEQKTELMAKAIALQDVERHSLQNAEIKFLENWWIPAEERNVSTLTLSVDKAGFDDLTEMAKEFRRLVQKRVNSVQKPDRVLQFSLAYVKNGKSWQHFEIDSTWTRYVMTPTSLLPPDSIGGNIGWESVKSHVTNVSIFGGAGGEFWIDDLVFYGIDFE